MANPADNTAPAREAAAKQPSGTLEDALDDALLEVQIATIATAKDTEPQDDFLKDIEVEVVEVLPDDAPAAQAAPEPEPEPEPELAALSAPQPAERAEAPAPGVAAPAEASDEHGDEEPEPAPVPEAAAEQPEEGAPVADDEEPEEAPAAPIALTITEAPEPEIVETAEPVAAETVATEPEETTLSDETEIDGRKSSSQEDETIPPQEADSERQAIEGAAQSAVRRQSVREQSTASHSDMNEPTGFNSARAAILSTLSPEDAAAFADVLDAILAQTSPEETEDHTERDGGASFLRGAHSLWSFAATRRPGEARVRLQDLELGEGEGAGPRTALEVVNDDMRYLLDSLSALIISRGLKIKAVLHPMVHVLRGEQGENLGLRTVNDPDAVRESWIQLQLDRIAAPEQRAEIEAAATSVLIDVRAAHRDRETIVERLRDSAAHLRQATPEAKQEAGWEAAAFLDWLADGHFSLFACRDYALSAGGEGGYVVSAGRGLGLMRDPSFTVMRGSKGEEVDWSPEMAAFIAEMEPVAVLKANRRSTVRRGAHFDLICVKRFGDEGRVVGQTLFVGLFDAAAYTRSPTNIPLLRRKVRRVVARSGFSEGGHDSVTLANILDIHPRDELFQASEEELRAQALGALQLKTRPRTRLFVRADRFGRYLSCLVYVSRERFDSALRRKIGQILCDATGGRVAEFTPSYGADGQIRIHFVIGFDKPRDAAAELDVAAVERLIDIAARDWSDGLRETLGERFGPAKGAALLSAYGQGFSAGYREAASPQQAALDLMRLDALSEEDPISVAFSREADDEQGALRARLYRYGEPAPLSDAIPILEHMGLRILEEHPHEILRRRAVGAPGAEGRDELYIHDFLTETGASAEVPLDERREVLEEGFVSIWRGEVEDDRLNRLILTAGLSARQLALLRAYSRFLRQARIPYSVGYMEDALIENPGVARALWRLFEAQFAIEPERDEVQRELQAERIETEIEEMLDQVARLDVDRILRRLRNAVRATVRTNFFQPDETGRLKDYFSFKFQSGALEDLPAPRPWREIFVYSAAVEGVHLRGGPVARGGLRWSDRREDFRTEVLGLVKAQQVKNAVIVPVGSKGGFLPKKLPVGGSREEIQAEAISCYRTFLRGMLDITDNLVEGEVRPPQSVARRDGDDPYLVVAADKGTATFSDIANQVAADYGFWLGDAFASGGGEGYDHKAMGITARGAWEAVKRHFRELGKDIQNEPFTVVGVGDMSGDVFGNGMLLSEQTRLLAAFDHRDIFIDPNPDAEVSYAERKRLFETPRTSWADYDKKLISKGGGVFSRNLKSIPLSAEIRELTGLDAASATPFELIQTLLGVKSDLLWFGGIGTYVKAENETHDMVGDRANDAVRVDASELGARVVGEGANLGVTQRGRIALSSRGVKINTDAVDNAGGVDCSDHEVNIKIALGGAMASGKLSAEERSALLREMTGEVAELVLASNYAQTGALSVLEAQAASRIDSHRRFIRAEEAARRLDRKVEALPGEDEITEREREGRGLTRPELAVLIAYAKTGLQETLLSSDLPDDPYLERWLLDYFPKPMRERFRDEILGHRLRREIIANQLANAFVNEGGPAYALRLQEETGAAPAEAVRAYLIARELFGFGELGREIDALDNKIAAKTQVEMRLTVSEGLIAQTLAVLQRGEPGPVAEAVAADQAGVAEVAGGVGGMLSDFSSERRDEAVARFIEAGAPEALAERLSSLAFLGGAVDVVDTARKLGRSVREMADTYFAAGARFRLEWLRITARDIEPEDYWERIAIGRLIADLRSQQSAIAAAALKISPEGCSGADAVESWAMAHTSLVSRADRVFSELRADGELSVAKLAVASSQLRGWET